MLRGQSLRSMQLPRCSQNQLFAAEVGRERSRDKDKLSLSCFRLSCKVIHNNLSTTQGGSSDDVNHSKAK